MQLIVLNRQKSVAKLYVSRKGSIICRISLLQMNEFRGLERPYKTWL